MWFVWFFGAIKDWLILAAPAMPPQCWIITVCVLLILFVAATIDAATGLVPDMLVVVGLGITLGAQAYLGSWNNALYHLAAALGAYALIWSINHAWYLITHRDALGMGDAKWTMVAVACFGAAASLFAWGMGAILAVLYMIVMRLTRNKVEHVAFAPFLFIGLCEGLHCMITRGFGAFLNI